MVSLELIDRSINKPVVLEPGTTVSALIFDANDVKVSDVSIEYPDQTKYPGWVILKVKSDITETWKEGELFLSAKVTLGDIVLKTKTVKFFVEKDIT